MEKDLDQTIYDKHFRVTIFGSARIKKGDPNYKLIYSLAKMISGAGMDIITGGGPGLMNAASEGHYTGRKDGRIHSIGLKINLPKENKESSHLNIKKEFNRFSNRLDEFMKLSNAVVVAPGGVGTLLELFYTWQLMKVKHICNVPIILLGDMWVQLVQWVKKYPLKNELLGIEDVELLFLAKSCTEAFSIIKQAYEGYKLGDAKFCLNYEKQKM